MIWEMVSLLSSREFLIFNVFRFQHFEKRIAEKKRVFTIIKTEAHLVKVSLKMLCTHTMPRSNDAPFQQRECGFYGVRMYVAIYVDFRLVLYSFVFCQDPCLCKGTWI